MNKLNTKNNNNHNSPIPVSLPPFPTELFPKPIQDMIIYQAEANQNYPDIPGMLALNVCSVSLKGKFEVHINESWREPLNLYTAMLQEHAYRSTFIRDMFGPVTEYGIEQLEEITPLIRERDLLASKIIYYNNKYAEDGNLQHLKKVKRLEDQLRNLSDIHLSALTVDSTTTPEALIHIMHKNNGQISIISDNEDPIKYKKCISIFLKAYYQDPIHFNDCLGAKIQIDQPNMSIFHLSTLPSLIHDLATQLFTDQLIGRFLISYPNEKLKMRSFNISKDVSLRSKQYDLFIKKLLNWQTKKPIQLRLSQEAIELLYQLMNELEKEFYRSQPELRTWNTKVVGQLVRIAGLLHVTSHAVTAESLEDVPVTISHDTLATAIQFKDYFIAHKQKVYEEIKKYQTR